MKRSKNKSVRSTWVALSLGLTLAGTVSTLAQTGSLLVDLDASTLTDPATWKNAGTLGDFTIQGTPEAATVAGVKAITFKGNGDAYVGPLSTANIEGNLPRTIEVWAFNPTISDEETLVAWGKRGGPNGSNMSFNYGANATYGSVGQWGTDLGWGTVVPLAGQWHYLVYTYDGTVAKVYDNGRLASQRTLALSTHPGNPVVVAAQNDAGGAPQAALSGTLSIARVRVRDSALTAAEILQGFAQDAGELQALNVAAEPAMYLAGVQQLSVTLNYAKMPNVALTNNAPVTYQSSDTNVLTVTTNGLVKAVGLGSATLTTRYLSKQAEAPVKVTAMPAPVLVHRYSFNEPASASTARDLAGSADGILYGAGTFTGTGQLTMNGTDTYVDLPNGIISALTNATFETWVTSTSSRTWERIFDFGASDRGEDQQGAGTTYLFLSPRGGAGVLRYATTITGGGAGEQILDGKAALASGRETHVAVVYNYSARTAKIYVDGKLVNSLAISIPLSAMNDINNWLGRSQFQDPYFTGKLNEFRIYEGALSDFEVAVSAAAGPDQPTTEAGELQSITLQMDQTIIFQGYKQAAVGGNYASVTNLNLAGMSGLAFASSNTNVVTIDAAGKMHAIGVGTVTITATYQGKKDSKNITVVQPPAVLAHRYEFNDPASATSVKDSVGTAHGTLLSGAVLSGDGQLVLDGAGAYVDLPNRLISTLTDMTVETWVTWSAAAHDWERIFDFGNSSLGEDQAGAGTTYLFLSPRGGSGVVRFASTITGGGAGEEIINGPAALTPGQETHLAVVYNYSGRVEKLFVNGKLADSRPLSIPLSAMDDVNNWLGRSQFSGDSYFYGQYNEFRIYDGVLTDLELALHSAAGPNVTDVNAASVKSLDLQTASPMLLGGLQNATLLAQYAVVSNVNVTALPEVVYRSLNPAVAAVEPGGLIQAVGVGTAAILATFNGVTASNSVTINAVDGVPQKPVLAHRYSFSGKTGDTQVTDSAGAAHGTLVGGSPAFTEDGQLDLNGGYVLLPSLIIGALTNITVETWTTWAGGADWQRVFDFGSTLGTPAGTGAGVTWFGLCPRRGDSQRLAFAGISPGLPETFMAAPWAQPTNQQVHLVFSYNVAANAARFYVDGQRVAVNVAIHPLSALTDTNNCIGASEWTWDPTYNGRFNEFRIYSGAMLDADVAASLAAGPNALPGESGPAPALQVSRPGGTLVLAWPASAAGYSLQGAASLGSGASWEAVSATPVVENELNKVTITPSGQARFYRLKK